MSRMMASRMRVFWLTWATVRPACSRACVRVSPMLTVRPCQGGAIQTAALASGVQFTPGGTWGPAPSSAGTNPAVTVTIGTHGLALVVLTANLMPTSANVSGNGVLASVALSGANTVAANTSTCVSAGTNAASASTQQANQVINIQSSTVTLLTGLTPGATTFAMQFSCDTTYPGQVGYCALIVVVL